MIVIFDVLDLIKRIYRIRVDKYTSKYSVKLDFSVAAGVDR